MFAVVSLNSCVETASAVAIEAIVATVSENFPKEVAEGIVCESVTTSGDNIVLNNRVTVREARVDGVRPISDEIKAEITATLLNSAMVDSNFRELLDLVVKAKYNMIYKFTDSSGDTISITIPYNELQ